MLPLVTDSLGLGLLPGSSKSGGVMLRGCVRIQCDLMCGKLVQVDGLVRAVKAAHVKMNDCRHKAFPVVRRHGNPSGERRKIGLVELRLFLDSHGLPPGS